MHDNTTTVTINVIGWQDDTPALINFNLSAQRVVLILYEAHSDSDESFGGSLAINLDGSRVAITHYAPFYNNSPYGVCVVWAGLLAAGAHTIQGQAQKRGASTTIKDRRLLAVIFDGTSSDFGFVRDTTVASTVGTTFVNDPNGTLTLNGLPDCKALVIYSQSLDGALYGESPYGKKTRIDIDGVYQCVPMQHSWVSGDAENTFNVVVRSLAAGNHTFSGQFAATYGAGETVRISERQLAVLIFSADLETDFVESSTQTSVAGNVLANDTQAHVSRALTATRHALAFYCASKRYGTSGTTGKKVAVNVDGTDYALTGQRPYSSSDANHKGYFSDVVTLNAGARTADGRFAAFSAAQTARVDDRTLSVLWFPTPILGPHKQNVLEKLMHGGL